MDLFVNRLILLKSRIRKRIVGHIEKERAYLRKLLFPLYLFPVKLLVYFFYYPIRIASALLIGMVRLLFRAVTWPFKKWANFFKAIIYAVLCVYLLFSLIVILDYLTENYGNYSKFFCGINLNRELQNKTVRIVGGLSEGSGFFIQANQVVTSFHVIADEPSPKVIFPDGTFSTPEKIIGSLDTDIAILYLPENYPDYAFPLMEPVLLYENEPLIAAGYALGTDLAGEVTTQRGRFSAFRSSKRFVETYIQTDINLVPGMSGGPLVDKCGKVVGVNTLGLAGLSLFISSDTLIGMMPNYSEEGIAKIEADPSTPQGAVEAFYTYLKARKLQEGFNLLSQAYLQKTNFEEWTNRFRDVLDVRIYGTRMEDERTNIVFLKFSTSNWVDGEREEHYYEGTWQTVPEDGVYKMLKSNIKEIESPEWSWFFE